jgi:hypothetical protein
MYGGTPSREIHQGGYNGPEHTEGESYDLTDPAVRTQLRSLDEHLCRVSDGSTQVVGIYQTIDPLAYQACAAGRDGWSFL